MSWWFMRIALKLQTWTHGYPNVSYVMNHDKDMRILGSYIHSIDIVMNEDPNVNYAME